MKIVTFKGGLGNQIFEFAFYLYIKKHVKSKIYGYYNKNWLNGHNRLEIQNIFDVELPKASILTNLIAFCLRFSNHYFKDNSFVSFDKSLKLKSIYFDGYWQNKKFYDKLENWIKYKDFQLDERNLCILEKIIHTESISLHVRRGDYLENHLLKKYGNICTISYYNKAVELIKNKFINPTFYIFSDDIEWTKNNFPLENSIYVSINSGKNSFIDMYLMNHCKANIIANSTFSYWGAYLNRNNSIAIYPKKWYNSDDLAPDIFKSNWIGI